MHWRLYKTDLTWQVRHARWLLTSESPKLSSFSLVYLTLWKRFTIPNLQCEEPMIICYDASDYFASIGGIYPRPRPKLQTCIHIDMGQINFDLLNGRFRQKRRLAYFGTYYRDPCGFNFAVFWRCLFAVSWRVKNYKIASSTIKELSFLIWDQNLVNPWNPQCCNSMTVERSI